MKESIKKIVFGLVIIIAIFGIEQTYKYFHNKYIISKQIEESIKRKHEAEKEYKKLDEAFKKIEQLLQEQIDFMENVCFAFWQGLNVHSNIAVVQCKCEKEMYKKIMPTDDIAFLMDNLDRFDFLLYKKDKKATEINSMLKYVRKKCVEKEKDKIKSILRKNNS